jgi:hypothetical protein
LAGARAWIPSPALKKENKAKQKQATPLPPYRGGNNIFDHSKMLIAGQVQWLILVIQATLGIRRIKVGGQPKQKVCEMPPQPVAGHGGTCLSFQLCRNHK